MRFTIRDLLWLTVVMALGVGWWIDRTETASTSVSHHKRALHAEVKCEALMEVIDRMGYQVGFDSNDLPDRWSNKDPKRP